MSDTIVELFKRRVNEFGPRPALLHKHEGRWEEQSWKEWWEQSERIAAGLVDWGLQPGDRVCILSNTRIEWVWLDMAITMAGGVVVPIYPSNLADQCAHILRDSNARLAIVEDPTQLAKLAAVRVELDGLEHVFYLDRAAVLAEPDSRGRRQVCLDDVADSDEPWISSFDALVADGRRRVTHDHGIVAQRRRQLSAGDLATIVYTSGTSGVPKGVEHTHAGLVAEVGALAQLELLDADDRQLLFLPLAHIFAKMLFLTAVGTGIQTAFAESLPRVIDNLREVRPTFFAGVPRIFEKIHAQLLAERDMLRRSDSSLFQRAVRRGIRFSRIRQRGRRVGVVGRLEEKLYRKLIFDHIQELFGGNLRFLFCGGAPLRADLAEFFHAAGILILEGYGLTETAAVSTLNLPGDFRFGSVGKPLPEVDVTIDEDDEILVRGSSVMKQYHHLPAETDNAFDEHGWFYTGDLGRFDRAGFLYITGRKKDLIITSGGKNIAPARVQALLIRRPFIKHAVVCGDARPFLSALITLDDAADTWAIQQGIALEKRADWAASSRMHERIEAEISAVNNKLPRFEQVRDFAILPEPLSVEAGELTPTGKVRRRAILSRYADLVDELYRV